MKPLPKQVKVGGHSYKVSRKGKAKMPEDENGHCDFDNCEIHLLWGMPLDKTREIFLHEILHACTYPSLVDKTAGDEEFVELIAHNLITVLRENPKLVEFLLDKSAAD